MSVQPVPSRYFVTAIGTGCGKTVVSAILTEALQADYWKPIQSGLEELDAERVKELVSNARTAVHPERWRLTQPLSPHAAAAIDGVQVRLSDFALPETANNLVIEGAGGLLVPLNEEEYVADLIGQLQAEVILVANLYLGSINHTLLSANELKRRGLPVKGIVFNGPATPASEDFILRATGWPCLLRLLPEPDLTPAVISRYAHHLLENGFFTL